MNKNLYLELNIKNISLTRGQVNLLNVLEMRIFMEEQRNSHEEAELFNIGSHKQSLRSAKCH